MQSMIAVVGMIARNLSLSTGHPRRELLALSCENAACVAFDVDFDFDFDFDLCFCFCFCFGFGFGFGFCFGFVFDSASVSSTLIFSASSLPPPTLLQLPLTFILPFCYYYFHRLRIYSNRVIQKWQRTKGKKRKKKEEEKNRPQTHKKKTQR